MLVQHVPVPVPAGPKCSHPPDVLPTTRRGMGGGGLHGGVGGIPSTSAGARERGEALLCVRRDVEVKLVKGGVPAPRAHRALLLWCIYLEWPGLPKWPVQRANPLWGRARLLGEDKHFQY